MWLCDYGLTMRAPNRKYNVPKQVLEEHLVIGWCNLVRVRTLCEDCHGYDPEMENWDQSPFHRNEVGSQNAKTLAIEGALKVPFDRRTCRHASEVDRAYDDMFD